MILMQIGFNSLLKMQWDFHQSNSQKEVWWWPDPPPVLPLTPRRASPHVVPRLRRPLIKMSFLIIVDRPVHFGKQLQRRGLAVAAAEAKYRHVTLVFSPVRWSRSDMRARKVGQQPSLPSGRWTTAHKHTHAHAHTHRKDRRWPVPHSRVHPPREEEEKQTSSH